MDLAKNEGIGDPTKNSFREAVEWRAEWYMLGGETVMKAQFLGESLSLASRGCAEPWREREREYMCFNF